MKKIILILFSLLLLSCYKKSEIYTPSFQEIKYYTLNSFKPSEIIKSELNIKKAIVLTYPEYIKESYELIKFISAVINKEKNLTIYHPLVTGDHEQIIDYILKKSPFLAFNEFINLYDYLMGKKISLTDQFLNENGLSLILVPETQYEEVNNRLITQLNEDEIIRVDMVGLERTQTISKIVDFLPVEKQVSSVRSKEIDNKIYILYGPLESHKPITPLLIYTEENYLEAPLDFLAKNKSIFKSVQINKMNLALRRQIEQSMKKYGE